MFFYLLVFVFFIIYFSIRIVIKRRNQVKEYQQLLFNELDVWEESLRTRYFEKAYLYDTGEITYQEFAKNTKRLLDEIIDRKELIIKKYGMNENEVFDYLINKKKRIS